MTTRQVTVVYNDGGSFVNEAEDLADARPT